MTIKELVGFQMISIDEEKIIVQKHRDIYTLDIKQDEGDCCGFNVVTTELYVDENDKKRNPFITKVEVINETSERDDSHYVEITFFGEVKAMAKLTSYSSSGSGWPYGACVTVVCKDIDMNEILTEW